jgi:Na+/melibiose symporter-like transporter
MEFSVLSSIKYTYFSEKDETATETASDIGLWRLMRENAPEWFFILIGTFCSCAMGAVMPIFAVIFASAVGILSYEDREAARSESVFYGVMFAVLGLGCFLLVFVQGFMFGISGLWTNERGGGQYADQ